MLSNNAIFYKCVNRFFFVKILIIKVYVPKASIELVNWKCYMIVFYCFFFKLEICIKFAVMRSMTKRCLKSGNKIEQKLSVGLTEE